MKTFFGGSKARELEAARGAEPRLTGVVQLGSKPPLPFPALHWNSSRLCLRQAVMRSLRFPRRMFLADRGFDATPGRGGCRMILPLQMGAKREILGRQTYGFY